MNLVILIDSVHMFFWNFGFRHATAALGEFAIGLAGAPKRRTEDDSISAKNGSRSAENVGRTLLKIKWQAGGEIGSPSR